MKETLIVLGVLGVIILACIVVLIIYAFRRKKGQTLNIAVFEGVVYTILTGTIVYYLYYIITNY